ncbi:glycoside hydrolase family 3 N-terminal domain-containing protein [Vibrio mexicanus]|uniref:glycoside hydrolase family 3 N-terminal domain-containing protein n=1 Tax=Vibrio mexicanus TaxID=1004326 RepID=UPI00063C04D5|nr:glycoside hydrolase family 3 N-terminal domain-containing protein [Vibrio mexicanus]
MQSNNPPNRSRSALVIGFPGTEFTEQQLAFIREHRPFGLMITRENIVTKKQLANVIQTFKEAVGEELAMVTTDQEGGRIQYLQGEEWQCYPIYGDFKELADKDLDLARLAAYETSLAMATEMAELGFNANCGPVLDLVVSGADAVMSNRCFHPDPKIAAELAKVYVQGHMDAGVMPMLKHIPGHGRATEDSHKTRPVIDAPLSELDKTDFYPFTQLNNAPMAMVAHLVISEVDDKPASISAKTVESLIRKRIGFTGSLISDCVYMESLRGPLEERCKQVQDAGVDLVLSCHGDVEDWIKWESNLRPLSQESLARLERSMLTTAEEKVGNDVDISRLMKNVNLALES